METYIQKILAALLLLTTAQFSWASRVYCEGVIEDWEMTNQGYLYVDGTWNNSDSSQRICSLEGAFSGISGEICKIWVSAAQAAAVTKAQVRFRYSDVGSCASGELGTWSATKKAPDYIRTVSQ